MEPLTTEHKEPGSSTWVPEQVDFRPTDDSTDAQKEKERRKEEGRGAAFTGQKKGARTAMERLVPEQRAKRASRKASSDGTDPASRDELQEKMRRGHKEWRRTWPQVQVISTRSAEEIGKKGSGTQNRASHRLH